MFRNFFRHLSQSFKSLKRNGWMTIASMTTISVALVIFGLFSSVLVNWTKVTQDLADNVRIVTYLNLDSEDGYEKTKNDKGEEVDNKNYHKVYDQIKALDGVDSIEFISKDEYFKKISEEYGEGFDNFEFDNPYYDTYIVTVSSSDQLTGVAKTIEEISGVDSVQYGETEFENIQSLAKFSRTWGLIGAGILFVVSILLISNTIRITIMARQNEIEIMRLVGAKNGYIRAPFLMEGAWIGLLGSIIPIALVFLSYQFAYDSLVRSLENFSVSLYSPMTALPFIAGILAATGMLIGSIGSGLSMRRFLKI